MGFNRSALEVDFGEKEEKEKDAKLKKLYIECLNIEIIV